FAVISGLKHLLSCNYSLAIGVPASYIELPTGNTVNIKFTYNHVINAAESLSFQPIKEEVRNKLLDYFKDGHSLSLALYVLEDDLHLSAEDEQELVELLVD
ncbi:20964_t:CDS:1, partial [Gigaspora margarita]